MSELVTSRGHVPIRGQFLATASALALVAYVAATDAARAEDADRPTVWIELGAQVEQVNNSQQAFAPEFLGAFDQNGFDSPLSIQRPARYAMGGEGKVTIEPRGSEWVFSISALYGRSNGQKTYHEQTPTGIVLIAPLLGNFAEKNLSSSASNIESHAIVDFQVGKDVGLGMISDRYSSTLSFGVRFVQFESQQTAKMNGMPDLFITGPKAIPHKYPFIETHHDYMGSLSAEHDFKGIGPSLNWSASRTILGKGEEEAINLEWGVNGAFLIGRQTVRGNTLKTGKHYELYRVTPKVGTGAYTYSSSSVLHDVANLNRTRTVIVPNVGAFAGLSWRYSDAKVSLGYRADFFFSAMDGGIDARKTYDRNFYGPFATVSIGLGG